MQPLPLLYMVHVMFVWVFIVELPKIIAWGRIISDVEGLEDWCYPKQSQAKWMDGTGLGKPFSRANSYTCTHQLSIWWAGQATDYQGSARASRCGCPHVYAYPAAGLRSHIAVDPHTHAWNSYWIWSGSAGHSVSGGMLPTSQNTSYYHNALATRQLQRQWQAPTSNNSWKA